MNLKKYYQRWQMRRQQKLPVVYTPHRAALERVQRRYALGFLCLILLFGYYAYRYTQHQAAQHQLVSVVVAKNKIVAPKVLEASDLTFIKLPQKWLPDSAFTEIKTLVGQTARRSLETNQMVLALDTQADLNPKSVSAQFQEAFAFTIGEDWLVAKLPNLKAGDTIDILAANPEGGLKATATVASKLKVIAVDKSGARKNLVVNTTNAQAQALLFTRSLRLPMQVLTHTAIEKLSLDNTPLNES